VHRTIVLILLSLTVGACKTAPIHDERPSYVPAFEFRAGVGGFPGGFNVLDVHSDGSSTYTYCEHGSDWLDPGDGRGQWRKLEFSLTVAQRRSLWDVVQEVDFFSLRNNYSDPTMVDGTARFVAVRERTSNKMVWCSNVVPAAIARIDRHVARHILKPVEHRRHATVPAAPEEPTGFK